VLFRNHSCVEGADRSGKRNCQLLPMTAMLLFVEGCVQDAEGVVIWWWRYTPTFSQRGGIPRIKLEGRPSA